MSLSIVDLEPSRVKRLVLMLRRRRQRLEAVGLSKEEAERSLGNFTLIVQATPLGLRTGDPSPISLRRAARGALAVDLVYHRETAFLREAARRGLKAVPGLGMLLHQGALSFETWTNRRAPLAVMEQALKRAIRSRR
jgi:shikimate dehydrogenase